MGRINPDTGLPYVTGKKFEHQESEQKRVASLIRKINATRTLTPIEKAAGIGKLVGLPSDEMEALDKQTGPALAEYIRNIISRGRATTRTTKQKSRQ